MKISTKGIYALEAMIELASRNTACVSIRDIADARNCSVKYLEQIFKQLKKAQLLISIRGKDGGYQIAKDPEEITAKDIILSFPYMYSLRYLSDTTGVDGYAGTNLQSP